MIIGLFLQYCPRKMNPELFEQVNSLEIPQLEVDMAPYIKPLAQTLVFVVGIYIEKFLRKKIWPKKKFKHSQEFRLKSRIIMMVLVTAILVIFNFQNQCRNKSISLSECFYFRTDDSTTIINSIIKPVFHAALSVCLLFSYHIYEVMLKNPSFLLERASNWKSSFWAPVLEELLFRACFFRASEEKVSIFYLALLFSVAHLHRYFWKNIINGKQYQLKRSLGQTVFTFVFGLLSFYFLSSSHSILSCFTLHCLCNIFGPPTINKQNMKFHLISIGLFTIYLYCFIHN